MGEIIEINFGSTESKEPKKPDERELSPALVRRGHLPVESAKALIKSVDLLNFLSGLARNGEKPTPDAIATAEDVTRSYSHDELTTLINNSTELDWKQKPALFYVLSKRFQASLDKLFPQT